LQPSANWLLVISPYLASFLDSCKYISGSHLLSARKADAWAAGWWVLVSACFTLHWLLTYWRPWASFTREGWAGTCRHMAKKSVLRSTPPGTLNEHLPTARVPRWHSVYHLQPCNFVLKHNALLSTTCLISHHPCWTKYPCIVHL